MKIKNRVKTHEEFQKVVRSGTYEKNRYFTIYFLENGYGYPRVGISAPVKLGNAVIRVTVRRQVRSMIREILSELKGYDYVIIVRKDYHLNTYKENFEELQNLFLKVRRKVDEKNS